MTSRLDTHSPLPLPQHHHIPIARPAKRQSPRPQLHRLHAPFTPHVPKLARPVRRQRRQLRLFHRVPCHPLHRARMSPQLGTIFHLRLLWVPDAEGAVLRASGDEMTGRVPGYGADSMVGRCGSAGWWRVAWWWAERLFDVRVRAGAA